MANIREKRSSSGKKPNRTNTRAGLSTVKSTGPANQRESSEVGEVGVTPAIMVVGGGIAGIQAALEVADAGNRVYLVERNPSIGGHMAQLGRLFPSLDDANDILTPLLKAVENHPNIELMSYSEVEKVSGSAGDFKVKIRKKARHVDEDKCDGCLACVEKCPLQAASEFDEGLAPRKVIYTPFAGAVPGIPVIDAEHCAYFLDGSCRECEKACDAGAIDLKQEDKEVEVSVSAVIVATGYDAFDPSVISYYGYGRYDNVLTALQFERMCHASGPTGGKLVLKDGSEPRSVAIIHCVGSRDKNFREYCSRVCCMYSLKFSRLIREKIEDAVIYEFYIDMRCFGKGYEEFYEHLSSEGVQFIRGKAARVTDRAQNADEKGKLMVVAEDSLLGTMLRVPVDMVVLSTAMEPRADAEEVSRLFNIGRSADGFFLERHPKMDTVSTTAEGIFIAGCAQGPKDITDTVVQASSAAAHVQAMLNKGQRYHPGRWTFLTGSTTM